MGRVLVLGSLNVDLVTHVGRHPRPGETVLGQGLERLAGGKGANQAVAAAAAGAAVAMLGAVGNDDPGRAYVERLRGLGIDTTGIVVLPGQPTGTALIVVDEAGENTIVVAPGANGRVGDDALAAVGSTEPGDVLLVQLEVPLDTVVRACELAARRGVRVVVNAAPYASLPPEVLAAADPVVVNEHEARQLAETSGLPTSLLVTFGAGGVAWNGLRAQAVQVPEDEVVDTTGAGDAFCGALAAGLAAGLGHEAALDGALAAGAAAVRHPGAQPEAAL
jgi:ribokinase